VSSRSVSARWSCHLYPVVVDAAHLHRIRKLLLGRHCWHLYFEKITLTISAANSHHHRRRDRCRVVDVPVMLFVASVMLSHRLVSCANAAEPQYYVVLLVLRIHRLWHHPRISLVLRRFFSIHMNILSQPYSDDVIIFLEEFFFFI